MDHASTRLNGVNTKNLRKEHLHVHHLMILTKSLHVYVHDYGERKSVLHAPVLHATVMMHMDDLCVYDVVNMIGTPHPCLCVYIFMLMKSFNEFRKMHVNKVICMK